MSVNKRNNWFDFGKVALEDLNLEQTYNNNNVAFANDGLGGSGVRLDFPQEIVIFDSNSLTAAQSGFVAVGTFDGRGILAAPVSSTDLDEGTQISVQLTDARITGAITTVVTILGKLFDNTLVYEHLEFTENGTRVTKNHFKEVTNILFQNVLGNSNTFVDGYGSFNTIGALTGFTTGRILVTEASSYKVSHDLIAAEQVDEPDIIFRDYKVYDPAKSLNVVLQEAVGTNNDVDDLDVNTTVASTRTFETSGSTETIYAQKFKMKGDNIQKITLLLGLENGTEWSGTLVVGVRPLLTTTDCPTDFLPDNEIDFDPDTVPIEAITLNQSQLADRGVVLTSTSQPVDFIFTDSQISNPNLSGLVNDQFYVITVRRTGSSGTGTIFLEEARNNDTTNQRLTVFTGNAWTDVTNSTLWYKVWSDSLKVASGVAYDEGVRLPIPKTELGIDGVTVQNLEEDIQLVNTSENVENYLIIKKDLEFSEVESHPRTGDSIFSRECDVPEFRVLEQADLITLLIAEPKTVPLARVKDNNSRANPTITGTLDHPGLALGNVINVVNPPSSLLTQNVIGSTIIPDNLNPTFKYRITSQETITDLFGDVTGDGLIDVLDTARIAILDGYQKFLATTGTFSSAIQQAAILGEEVDILELIRGDVDESDGYEITSADLAAITAFINSGTAFPNGQSNFTRVRLEVESILDPERDYDSDGVSTLLVESDNGDLVDPSNFSITTGLTFQINFIPTWDTQHVEILDLRRFVTTTFLEFDADDIQTQPENGGKNSLFIPGDLFLDGNVLNLDGTFHSLDHETNTIELELPSGNTEGEINVFEEYVVGLMHFGDGTLVSAQALNSDQVKFEVSIGSHVKNVSDGSDGYIDFDGYSDGYGANADEVIGTFIDHDTGLLRIRAFNIVRNEFFPELRTRVLVAVSLKKAGFANSPVEVGSVELASKLQAFSP
jgi:hypothetical protein